MNIKRPFLISTALILIGAVTALAWLYLTGGEAVLVQLQRVRLAFAGPLLAITAVFLFARFIRWQFLLRRFDVRIATKPSLSVYLASLIGTATPAYIGEAIIRSVFMRQRFSVPVRLTIWVLGAERLLDVIVLSGLGLLLASTWWLRGVMLLFLAAAVAIWLSGSIFARRVGIPRAGAERLRRPDVFLQSILLSLAVWVPAALLFSVASAGLNLRLGPLTSASIFSTATLLGGLTLMPAGVGSTGSLAILQLQEVGLTLAQSVIVTSLVRLTSTGVLLTTSAVFLVHEWQFSRQARRRPAESAIHFDDIALEYDQQFQEHIWDYLLNRKVTLMTDALDRRPSDSGLGLDLGCGLGQQCLEMARRGYQVVGLDVAQELLRQARMSGVTVTNGSALALPFANESLDFVYTVGVLHHLSDWSMQLEATGEVARVLKPGGLFIIHETNTRNPLFRFYMGYIFPILRTIDEGIESWIDPRQWENAADLALVDVAYFTFLPDFIPAFLMRPFRGLERWFESSRFNRFSVHYMAVLQKGPLQAREDTSPIMAQPVQSIKQPPQATAVGAGEL